MVGLHLCVFILGLTLTFYTSSRVHASSSVPVKCSSQNISVRYQHCVIHRDGVHALDCFGKYTPRGVKRCVWKPGKYDSEKTYTLIIRQQYKKHCYAYDNITEVSQKIVMFQKYNMTAEVLENAASANCTKAVFAGSLENVLRCGPPYDASFRRHSGKLLVNVSWQDDAEAVKHFSVRYKAVGERSWSQSPVQPANGEKCVAENLNSSLVYVVQIRCVTNKKCSQCVWSGEYTVPTELTMQPFIVSIEDVDVVGRKGCRLLSLTWKFPANQMHDGYRVSVGKASGEEPRERLNATRPEIRLILSDSAYELDISAVNNASTSPAVRQTIGRRGGGNDTGDGKLNVTVHSNTSFTVFWRDDLIKSYVCFSVEWMKTGRKASYMSFYQQTNNYRTVTLLPEPLAAFERYSITLHTRPDKNTCNMKHVNNSESTYGTTHFYLAEGAPVAAPENISSHKVALNSAELRWLSIMEDDIRGFLLGYVIYYTEYQGVGTTTERNVTVDPTLNSYELEHLKAGTAYEVQMSGFTRAGVGVRSTASLFKTKDQGFSNLGGIVSIVAVVATVLICGPPIIKRTKVILWPSIPNPGNSNAMRKIEEPCELELLESIKTLKVEEWETDSLRIVEKEETIALPPTLPLLEASEDEGDSPESTGCWDATGDFPSDITAEMFPDVQRPEPRSSPLAFSSDYTTMALFQQGMLQGTNTAVTETKPEVKPGLDYTRQFSTSPIWDCEEMPPIL